MIEDDTKDDIKDDIKDDQNEVFLATTGTKTAWKWQRLQHAPHPPLMGPA